MGGDGGGRLRNESGLEPLLEMKYPPKIKK